MPTEQIQKITFKKLIMTIGNLPSSYVESLSYYECMLWLCNYLENTVVPAVCAGPIPNNSEIPCSSSLVVTSGNLRMAFISEANTKPLPTRA